MSGDSTYFFAPSAEPFNPNIEDNQRRTQELIGRNHVGYFDELGYHYFTREVYDAFYPGYGDMWPTLHGAVSMTYEQGSARGLSWRRPDGSILTYGDGVDRNFVTSLSTIEAAAPNRVQLLGEYTDFRASGGRQANGNAAAVFDASTNSWNADRLARQLAYQGITVERLEGRQSCVVPALKKAPMWSGMTNPRGVWRERCWNRRQTFRRTSLMNRNVGGKQA